MNSFYGFLTKEIIDEISMLLTNERDPIRVLFSGFPKYMLDKIFVLLTDGEKKLKISRNDLTKYIPVLLVDPDVTEDPKNLDSGKCTNNHLVTVRNTEEGSYFALHAIDDATNLSSETAAERKGISTRNHQTINEWLEEPFVFKILNSIDSKLPNDQERKIVKEAIKEALTEAWDADQRHSDRRAVWGVLEDIYNVIDSRPESRYLCEKIGVPSIEDDEVIEAFKLPKKIAAYFVDNGFTSGSDLLVSELSDKDTEIKDALFEFTNAISKNCLVPSDFNDNPMLNYAKAKEDGESNWWSILTNKTWYRLLGGSDETQKNILLNIACLNPLYRPVSKNHPEVIQKGASFLISPTEEQGDEITLEISKSSGNKTLQVIDTITIKGEDVTWVDKEIEIDHDFFIKYQFSSKSAAKPLIYKIIDIEYFKPKVTMNCRSAIKITPFKFKADKGKKAKQNNKGHYECQIELNGIGSHTLDLYHKKGINFLTKMTPLSSGDSDSDTELTEKNITPSSDEHAVCLIEAEEDCVYEFQIDNNGIYTYKINISVNEFTPKGVSSEFRKLVIESCGGNPGSKVDVKQTMLSDLENWILSDKDSYCPAILGPDFKNKWTKPTWNSNPVISDMKIFLDPRPGFESINSHMAQAYIASRDVLRRLLKDRCDKNSDSIESLNFGVLYLEEDFKGAVDLYLKEYLKWLRSDYETAIWSDIISVHSEESGNNCLKSIPDAAILSPFHPVRVAWHCNAQSIFEEARKNSIHAPSTGVVDPSVFPDCFALPCLNANSAPEYKGYAAVRTSSDYWSVLWNTDTIASQLNNENYESIFGDEFGISIDGMIQGFSIQQVKRSLDDVRQLACAKSTLTVSLTSDTIGQSSCNLGIEKWCEEHLGLERDEWSSAGANSLKVYDTRAEKAQPEPAILASLTARSGTNVRWYTENNNDQPEKRDLAIIDHLKTMSNSFEKHQFKSAVDQTGLFRKSIKHSFSKQNKFLAESRVGYFITAPIEADESIRNVLLNTLDTMENSCIEYDLFDSMVYAPNLNTLENSFDNTDFCAVSSSTIDASCFHMPDQISLLWDYELPKYSSDVGQSSGFYLLARESDNMHEALKNALIEFQEHAPVDKKESKSLLQEISLRGMPTLKKLTSGGTSSFGEIGMLVALRLLQTEFQVNSDCDGLISVFKGSHINLIVPADIFQPRFDSLRAYLKSGTMERPDLIVISISLLEGKVNSIRLTPVEVKARSEQMTQIAREDAIKQTQTFATFLEIMLEKSQESAIWGLAWREMLASWIDYGFRVYGEIESIKKRGAEWSKLHQETLIDLMSQSVEIEIDNIGRLISLEKCISGKVISTAQRTFKDTIVLSYHSAAILLSQNQESVIKNIANEVGDWGFLSKIEGVQASVKGEPVQSGGHKAKEVDTTVPDQEVEAGQESSLGIHFMVGESLDKFENKEAMFYPGNTALNNINIGVVGDLGTGKTQLLKSLVYQLVSNPASNRGVAPKVLILDYKRDFSDLNNENCDFISKANVKVIKPIGLPLNMFNTSDSSASTPWLDRYSFFRDVLGKIFSTQKPLQDSHLKKAVKKCFSENDGRDPTIYEVFDAYEEIVEGKVDTTYSIMEDIIDYEIFESNPDKIINFEEFFDGTVALDLSGFSDDKIKNMVIVIFLNFYFDYMKKVKKQPFLGTDPQTRFIDSYLLVDEAHNIMPYEFPVLSKLLLQGREFGVGVILASQYFSHFKTNNENYMEPIQSWFVHKVPGIRASDLDRMGLPSSGQSTISRIATLEVFESLFKTLDHNGEFIKGIPFYKLD